LLDSVGVIGPGGVENILLLLDLTLCPLLVHRATILSDGCEDTEKTECCNSLLVENVELVADRGDRKTSTGGEDGRLRNKGVSRQGIYYRLGLGFGILSWNIGGSPG
jgi:hypothetical protein